MRKLFGTLGALILASALIIGVFTVGATASENEVTAASEEIRPEIVSKNMSYSAYLHLYYAIPKSTVKEGYLPELRLYKEEPSASSTPYYTVTEYELQTISVISGTPEEYYVMRSDGISAKEMGEEIYAQPVAVTPLGDEIVGDFSKYSVAEYLYERLYKNGFISMTEEDGEDYLRRTLYEALLEYGKAAQKVLIEDKLGVSVKYVTDYSYYYIDGNNYGFYESGKTVVAPIYDGTPAKGYEFVAWDVVSYNGGVGSAIASLPGGGSYTLTDGVITIRPSFRIYDEILAQEGVDDLYIAEKWAELEKVAGKELTDALKTLYSLYGNDMADWSASLYSKGFNDLDDRQWAGGYYASTNGRDTVGLGPDVQCTEQMFRFILQSGMLDQIGGSVAANLPDWVGYQVVYFVKSLQSSENGYFYHPQWGQALTDAHLSRRGRDLGWATSLLSRFGSAPSYDTPNGKKGDGISADEYLLSLIEAGLVDPSEVPDSFAEKHLTSTLSVSSSAAVSRVVLVDVAIENAPSSDNTDHLKSYVGLINYMLGTVIPGMDSDPYSMGNEISSIQSEIKTASAKLGGTAEAPTPYVYTEGDEANTDGATAEDYKQFEGMTMMEIAIHGLNLAINTEIGLWGEKSDNNPTGTEFLFTNGFMKAMALYNDYGATYPYPVAAAKALMTGLLSDQPSTGNICEVYNIWTAIDRLQTNIKNHFDEDKVLEYIDGEKVTAEMVENEINKVFEESAPEAVLNSYRKILGYKKVDGGFGHSYTSGTPTHQGLKVSNGANVSDVDATCIGSTGLTREIFAALGLTKYTIPIFTKSDWMRYVSILEGAEPVRKGSSSAAENDFSEGKIPDGFTAESGTVKVITYKGSGALLFAEGEGAILKIDRSDVSNIGSVLKFATELTPAGTGEYELRFTDNGETVYSLALIFGATGLTVKDGASSAEYNIANIYPMETIELLVEMKLVVCDGETSLAVTVYVDNAKIYERSTLDGTEGFKGVSRLAAIDTAALIQTTPCKTVLDNTAFVITEPKAIVDFEDKDISEDSSVSLDLGGITAVITEETKSQYEATTEIENGNKYLHFNKIYGNSNVKQSQSYIHLMWASLNGDSIVFNADMRINNTANKNYVKLNLLSPSGVVAWQILIGEDTVRTYSDKSNFISESFSDWGITEGEWFDLTITVTTASDGSFVLCVYIDEILRSTYTHIFNKFVQASEIVDLGIIPEMSWLGTIDIDNIDVHVPDEDEVLSDCIISGELTFDDFAEGDWTVNEDGIIRVGHYIQTNAQGTTTVVSEDGVKFLRMAKTGCNGSDSRQSWLVIERTNKVSQNEALILDITMRHDQVNGSSSYLRFYNGRTAANANNGTVFGSGADRNVMFNVSSGKVCFGGTSLGVAEGEWFTLRLMMIDQTVYAFVQNADGEFEYKASVTRSVWPDFSTCTAVVLMNDSTTFHTTDVKSIYFGGLPEYLTAEDLAGIGGAPEGSVTFEDIAEGSLANGKYGEYALGYVKQSNATADMSVVTDGENKVLSLNKTGYGSGESAQTWLNVGIKEGSVGTKVFQARMKLESWTNLGSGCYFRLYSGRKVESDGGTNLSGNININGSGGTVSLGGVSTGAKVGEWFTLRITMATGGYTVEVLREGQLSFDTILTKTDKDYTSCDVFTCMTANENLAELRFDYIYFGSEP